MPFEGGSPEVALLLNCARSLEEPAASPPDRNLLRNEVDWSRLLSEALAHGMKPPLYRHLKRVCPGDVPEGVMGHLEDRYRENGMRNLLLAGELLRLSGLFERRGIPVIPYKGPTLAALAYRNLALRKAGDLDVLIRRDDFERARELLLSSGYRPTLRLSTAQKAAFIRFERECAFVHEDTGVEVELQWEVVPRHFCVPLEFEDLWTRVEPISFAGGTVPTLAPEDLLLILCAHGCKHSWERLVWVCDVAELVRARSETLDWDLLLERATAMGIRRILFLGLFLAKDLLGAELPEEVARKLEADPKVRILGERVRAWTFDGGAGTRGFLEGSTFRPFDLETRERPRDKVRYCLRTLMTPNEEDWMHTQLPKAMLRAYYPLRILRLGKKYGRRLSGRPL